MKSQWIIRIACIGVLAPFTLFADDTAGNAEKKAHKRPDAIDKDGDGKVSYEELKVKFPKLTEAKFKTYDKNGDGFVTQEERPNAKTKPQPASAPAAAPDPAKKQGMEAVLVRADSDHNGKVTFDELHAVAPRMTQEKFAKLDRNGDGVIAQNDSPNLGSDKGSSIALVARKADTDHDGKVTYEEMLAVTPKLPRERFDQFDVNKDGVLSAADRAQMQRDDKQGTDDGIAKLMESDANNDGTLTFEELTAAKPGFPREAFDKADRNKDGAISLADGKKK